MRRKGFVVKIFSCIFLVVFTVQSFCQTPDEQAQMLKKTLAKGWNTWDTYSQISYVHMPEGVTVNLAFKEYKNGSILQNPLLYKAEQKITLGPHSDDGSYTDQTIEWEKMRFRIQSAVDVDNLIILVTPLEVKALRPPVLVAEAGRVWQMPGTVSQDGDNIQWTSGNYTTSLFGSNVTVKDPYLKLYTPYNLYEITSEAGISTGRKYTVTEIKEVIKRQSEALAQKKKAFGDQSEIFNALQSSIAWNVVYDPLKQRIIIPVSRSWNEWHGGYVLFCWDNYFVSYMLSLYNKDLAYVNALAITNEASETGFVPNFSDAAVKSRDRSEPPVGSFCIREIYRKYHEKWFLSAVYDNLLSWNRWWASKRDVNGLLAWGSNAFNPATGNYWETKASGVSERQGASYESGMDNAPMYFNIPFDSTKEVLKLWDVGLNSLYILDCFALADIAKELGKTTDFKELTLRGNGYSANLNKLWNEKQGIYCNRRTDNGAFSPRLSPTCFYPLLTDVPDKKKIDRMMKEHFYNSDEFYGEWMIPSVPRNDTSFKAQNYWQGRIWAPLNFLVYIGLRKHNLTVPREELVLKSKSLLLKNWLSSHYVCENYNTLTGIGAEKGTSSDPFYHWGALLGFMEMIEKGIVDAPEKPLK